MGTKPRSMIWKKVAEESSAKQNNADVLLGPEFCGDVYCCMGARIGCGAYRFKKKKNFAVVPVQMTWYNRRGVHVELLGHSYLVLLLLCMLWLRLVLRDGLGYVQTSGDGLFPLL